MIAVITILAAIIFPVISKVRENARQSSCMSNLKQLALAFSQYSQDNNGINPNGVNWYLPGGNGWAGQVNPYVKSNTVYLCPDDGHGAHCSYAYNSNNTSPTGHTVSSYGISKYSNPSKTVLLFEVTGNHLPLPDAWDFRSDSATYGSGGYSPAGWGVSDGTNFPYAVTGAGAFFTASLQLATGYFRNTPGKDYPKYFAATGRHSNGANYLMVDGHAKWLNGNAITAGTTSPTPTQCNIGGYKDRHAVPIAAGPECSDTSIEATFSL